MRVRSPSPKVHVDDESWTTQMGEVPPRRWWEDAGTKEETRRRKFVATPPSASPTRCSGPCRTGLAAECARAARLRRRRTALPSHRPATTDRRRRRNRDGWPRSDVTTSHARVDDDDLESRRVNCVFLLCAAISHAAANHLRGTLWPTTFLSSARRHGNQRRRCCFPLTALSPLSRIASCFPLLLLSAGWRSTTTPAYSRSRLVVLKFTVDIISIFVVVVVCSFLCWRWWWWFESPIARPCQ